MPEMLTPKSAIMGAGLGNDVALLTDGRFSRRSHRFIALSNRRFLGRKSPPLVNGSPPLFIKGGG
jgi:dihydroxy-acid dehydratase